MAAGPDDKPAAARGHGESPLFPHPWLDLYKEVCLNIRTTDDISFKLLGLVPVVAGSASGALTLLEKFQLLDSATPGVVLTLAVAGFAITLGLFLWERRNIEKCRWLIARAGDLESYALNAGALELEHIQYLGWNGTTVPARTGTRRGWGKADSEAIVYAAAMLVWCVPAAVSAVSLWHALAAC